MIMAEQLEFLDRGEEAMRLDSGDTEQIDMHESTVSRLPRKNLRPPRRGCTNSKYFFPVSWPATAIVVASSTAI